MPHPSNLELKTQLLLLKLLHLKIYERGPKNGSGSGRMTRIHIILGDRDRHPEHADPNSANLDWYQFQHMKNFQYAVQNT